MTLMHLEGRIASLHVNEKIVFLKRCWEVLLLFWSKLSRQVPGQQLPLSLVLDTLAQPHRHNTISWLPHAAFINPT